jgi:hypothetical protein
MKTVQIAHIIWTQLEQKEMNGFISYPPVTVLQFCVHKRNQ